MQRAAREQFFRGLKAGVPVMFGFIPVAIAYALAARQAGFSAPETILMSLMVYAGASQMMAVGMVGAGSAMGPIVLATFLLNLRHFIMSTYVMRELPEKTRLPQRLLAALLLDPAGMPGQHAFDVGPGGPLGGAHQHAAAGGDFNADGAPG